MRSFEPYRRGEELARKTGVILAGNSDLTDGMREQLADVSTDDLRDLADYELDCNGVQGPFCDYYIEREAAEMRRAELAMTPTFPEFNLEEEPAHVG